MKLSKGQMHWYASIIPTLESHGTASEILCSQAIEKLCFKVAGKNDPYKLSFDLHKGNLCIHAPMLSHNSITEFFKSKLKKIF